MLPKLNLYYPKLFFVVIPKSMLQKRSAFKILIIEIYRIQISNAQNLEYAFIQNHKYTILDVYLEITESCPDTLYVCCVVIYSSSINNKYYL